MKHIINIAIKDIRQTMRDKMTFMFLLFMPVLFTLLFGFAFGGISISNSDSDTRLPVSFLDQDHTPASAALKELLLGSQAIRLESVEVEPADLENQVAAKTLSAAIVVPAGYGASVQSGAVKALAVYADTGSSGGMTAQAEIQAAAVRLVSAASAARAIQQNAGGSFDEILAQTVSAWSKPPVQLSVTSAGAVEKDAGGNSGLMSVTHTAPGMMIQFAIAGLITAAQVLVGERKSRCMQRLLTTAVARHEILLGHFLAIFATIFVQLVLLVAFGQIVLKLDYLRQPAATLIMIFTTALLVAALGLLIGSLAKSDDQAVIFSLVPMFVFAGLGGAWVPLEVTGQAFQVIGHLSPVAWAMDGFEAIIARGLDLNAIWLPAGALVGYALLFFTLAVWKFKFE